MYEVRRGCGGTFPGLRGLEAARLRAVPWRDALLLRIFGRRHLHEGLHQGLIRRNPVTDDHRLRTVPLLELYTPASFMIAAGEGNGGDEALCPSLPERRCRDGEVFEPPLHLGTRQWLVPKFAHGPADPLCGVKAFQQA